MVKIKRKKIKRSKLRPKSGVAESQDTNIDSIGGDDNVLGDGDDAIAGAKRKRTRSEGDDDGDGFELKKKKTSLRATDIGIAGTGDGQTDHDGFSESDQGRRQQIEDYLKGNLREDVAMREKLAYSGMLDKFDPTLEPKTVESFGAIRAADHVIRMYDDWMLSGLDREAVQKKAVDFFAEFESVGNIRKVITELENGKPIRDIYPVEIIQMLLEKRPELIPGVKVEPIFERASPHKEDRLTLVEGQPTTLRLPENLRVKSFGVLNGQRPGYRFEPGKEEGTYQLTVDSPGTYQFQVFAVEVKKLMQMVREKRGGLLDTLNVQVDEAPYVAPIIKSKRAEPKIQLGSLTAQVQDSLNAIERDDDGSGAATYRWSLDLKSAGATAESPSLGSIELTQTAATDPVWQDMVTEVNRLLERNEPEAPAVKLDDFRLAIRRARKNISKTN